MGQCAKYPVQNFAKKTQHLCPNMKQTLTHFTTGSPAAVIEEEILVFKRKTLCMSGSYSERQKKTQGGWRCRKNGVLQEERYCTLQVFDLCSCNNLCVSVLTFSHCGNRGNLLLAVSISDTLMRNKSKRDKQKC